MTLSDHPDLYAALRACGAAPDDLETLIQSAPATVQARLATIDQGLLRAILRKSHSHEAITGATQLRAALADCTPAPMLDPAPRLQDCLRLYADDRQGDMPAYSDPAFDRWFAATGARYGIGSYGEKRSVYASAQFADQASPERRTLHMGIDVFAPAGTQIFAPLGGYVHQISYNADPLDYGHTLILRHDLAGHRFYTLYGHLAANLPERLTQGQPVEAGQLIADFGDWPENGGWAPHLHFQIIADMLEQRENFFGVAHESLWDIWQDICPDPNLLLRLPQGILA